MFWTAQPAKLLSLRCADVCDQIASQTQEEEEPTALGEPLLVYQDGEYCWVPVRL